MTQEDMQKMMGNIMQGAQQMQACIAKVDQAAVEQLMQEGESLEAEVSALCKQGKRSKAQSAAMGYVKRIQNDANLKQMQSCGEMAKQMMPTIAFDSFDVDDSLGDVSHVCDNYTGSE